MRERGRDRGGIPCVFCECTFWGPPDHLESGTAVTPVLMVYRSEGVETEVGRGRGQGRQEVSFQGVSQ